MKSASVGGFAAAPECLRFAAQENPGFTHEADALCDIVGRSADKLRHARAGDRTKIDDKVFACVDADKNVIYRIDGEHTWYLKFCPPIWIEREVIGARAVSAALVGQSAYLHPDAVRISEDFGFTLYSAFPGRTFNTAVLVGSAVGWRSSSVAWIAFRNLGTALGRLHRYGVCGDRKALNPDITTYLRKYLESLSESTETTRRIGDWLERHPVPETRTWIQGNVKSADIRLFRGRAALFDFGTCGLGVPYEDLAGLCAQLLLFRAALLFPWWLPRRAMSLLLAGYGEEFEYDRGELLDYVARGVFRYYLKNVLHSAWTARISGIPLIRGRVEYLIRQMAEGEWSDALHGVDF